MMTLAERLQAAKAHLARLDAEKRQIADQAMAVDIALVKCTGAIELLTELLKDGDHGE